MSELAYPQGAAINSTGSTAAPSAILDVSSTDKGFLPPRMTDLQMKSVISPATGLLIYNIDCESYFYYDGSSWTSIGDIRPEIYITASPAGAICSGTGITFTANSSNGGNSPQYQWRKNNSDIPGETNTTFACNTLVNGDVITCYLTPNNPCITNAPVISNSIVVVVNPDLPVSINITTAPGTTICSGTSTTFSTVVVNGGTSPAYQWKKNGSNITGATSSSYTTSSLANGDVISCQLTSNATCATGSPASNSVSMTVIAPPTTANAGPDQSIVATSTTLAANTPASGTGLWTIISGSGGSITSPSSPTSAFTGVAGTSYVLQWTISNGPCTSSSDQVTINLIACTVGASLGGGIVFYNGGQGQCYVAPTSDQSTGAQWGCSGTSISTATAIGTGASNTTAIVNGCSTSGIAAKICDALVLNTYSDWFLPSKDELNEMYKQRSSIGGFTTDFYWSSSAYSSTNAWDQSFSASGTQNSGEAKTWAAYVRCARKF